MLQDPDLLALQEVRTKVEKAWAAWQRYRAFSQEQIDEIVERMASAAREHSQHLAELAVEETGYGNARDKLAKNLLACDVLPRHLRGMKTVGILRDDTEKKVVEIGVPVGVVAAVLPTTNPTSTAIYKTIIALKAGNGIVLSPHPRARRCTCETIAVLYNAAREAGAPEDLIQCINNPTLESTNELMRHKRTAVILSTGGSGIVKAAYSSGKPALGVGPGNVPVLLDTSADIPDAIAKIVQGKSFDYGTVCSSEQALVTEAQLRDKVIAELKARKAHVCSDAEKQALTKVLLVAPNWAVNPKCVGQAPVVIAEMAGFSVPSETSILVVELEGVGRDHPLSAEKLSPVLSLFFVKDFAAALDTCEAILKFGGLGHTCAIYTKDDARARQYALRMPAMRVLCNTPTPQGSTGITTNLFPAMTLGCGAVAGNSTGDNIGPQHLMNVKRLAYAVRNAEDAFEMPAQTTKSPKNNLTQVAGVSRDTLVSAVEKYLAGRGIASAPQAQSTQGDSPAAVVDRFLSSRRASDTMPQPATSAACPIPTPTQPAAAPAPTVKIVDFVSENDVRVAVNKSEKIYIGPKTIVTPSARDLATQHDIFVVAKK
jgi:acetaldehyde dehydrogenase (acetylating)